MCLAKPNNQVSHLKEFGRSNEDVGRLAFEPQLLHSLCYNLVIVKMNFFTEFSAQVISSSEVKFLQDNGIRNEAIGDMLAKFPPLLSNLQRVQKNLSNCNLLLWIFIKIKMPIEIPQDILVDILLRLPAKSLLRCRSVSKSWFNQFMIKTRLTPIGIYLITLFMTWIG